MTDAAACALGSATARAAVAEARRWIGTPYRHGAAVRGAGADCLGLLRGVWRALHGAAPAVPASYAPAHNAAEPPDALRAGLTRCAASLPGPRHGAIALLRLRDGAGPRHLGVLDMAGPAPVLIHALSRHGVVASPLCAAWSRRIVGCFAFPEIA